MRSDSAPLMVNLFLCYYESKCIRKIKKVELNRTREFARFINDLTALNDGAKFHRSYKEIYPPELELKTEITGKAGESFLDLYTNIKGNIFSMKLFGKIDAFTFSIVRMPHLLSNFSFKMFYAHAGQKFQELSE